MKYAVWFGAVSGVEIDDERAGGGLDDRLFRRRWLSLRRHTIRRETHDPTIATCHMHSMIDRVIMRMGRRVDDSRRVPDVVEARNQRDRQRRVDARVEDHANDSRGS